jgi:phosphoenolpyruvate carboxylase
MVLSADVWMCDGTQAELDRLVYSPVWTAHPTEARRRVVMNSLRRMFVLLQQINDPRLHSTRAHDLQAELECEVETLWRTDEMRDVKPSVLDEILNGLTYYRCPSDHTSATPHLPTMCAP